MAWDEWDEWHEGGGSMSWDGDEPEQDSDKNEQKDLLGENERLLHQMRKLDKLAAKGNPNPRKPVKPDPLIGPGGAPTRETTLPNDPAARKRFPVATGVLDYFPDALVAVSEVSYEGNVQHNGPNTPLQWTRGKSGDESDAMIRHYLRRGTRDADGVRHSAKMVWRALAYLQKEIESERTRVNEHE